MVRHVYYIRLSGRQAGRQADRQTDRQTDRQKQITLHDKQGDFLLNREINREISCFLLFLAVIYIIPKKGVTSRYMDT